MKRIAIAHVVGLLAAAVTVVSIIDCRRDPDAEPPRADAVRMVPVETDLPRAQFTGTKENMRAARVKPVQTEPGPPFLVPEGTKNVALGKPVSSSDPEPIFGDLAMITDGDKEAADGSYIELGPLLQHITIDLGARHDIYGLRLWHFHKSPRVYFDVIVQISDDPNFATGVRTIFNNDMDNSVGLSAGSDMHYVETYFGEIIDAHGTPGRYVRLYSNGSTAGDLNHYIEVEVYGKPTQEEPALVSLKIDHPPPMFIGLGSWRDVPYRGNSPTAPPRLVPDSTPQTAIPPRSPEVPDFGFRACRATI